MEHALESFETSEEEIVEEEVVEPVKEEDSSGNIQDTISAEVKEEIKKAADAIKDKVSVSKEETTVQPEKENVKLEISDTIQELESKIESKKEESPTTQINTETPTFKIDTSPTTENESTVKSANISFNDTDSIVKYDTKAKPSNTPEPENVTAPKTIERLEEISHVRNEQRKLEEAEEDDDDEEDKLTIFNEAPSLQLDALDVQVLDDSLSLKKPPILTGVETLV